jgi:hypothetical protein
MYYFVQKFGEYNWLGNVSSIRGFGICGVKTSKQLVSKVAYMWHLSLAQNSSADKFQIVISANFGKLSFDGRRSCTAFQNFSLSCKYLVIKLKPTEKPATSERKLNVRSIQVQIHCPHKDCHFMIQ